MADFIYSKQPSLFGQQDIVGFGTADFSVQEIMRELANELIVQNHYSQKFYNATYINLGVMVGDEVKGVLQFGYAMNPASMASVVEGTAKDEYLELNRMWLCDSMPKNSESRALSHAIKYIRRRYPKIKWIQSFADERCGKFGAVYQACSFDYCGEHDATFWRLDGTYYHNSLMTRAPELSKAAARLQSSASRAIPHKFRQFRYIKFMQPRFRRGLRLKVQPYPKPDNAARPADEPSPEGASLVQPQGAAP